MTTRIGSRSTSPNGLLLSRASDRLSFLYIERARVHQSDHGTEINPHEHPTVTLDAPGATLSCLILGHGTPSPKSLHPGLRGALTAWATEVLPGIYIAMLTTKQGDALFDLIHHEMETTGGTATSSGQTTHKKADSTSPPSAIPTGTAHTMHTDSPSCECSTKYGKPSHDPQSEHNQTNRPSSLQVTQ